MSRRRLRPGVPTSRPPPSLLQRVTVSFNGPRTGETHLRPPLTVLAPAVNGLGGLHALQETGTVPVRTDAALIDGMTTVGVTIITVTGGGTMATANPQDGLVPAREVAMTVVTMILLHPRPLDGLVPANGLGGTAGMRNVLGDVSVRVHAPGNGLLLAGETVVALATLPFHRPV